MPIGGFKTTFIDETASGVNTNNDSSHFGPSIDLGDASLVIMDINGETGTHNTHEVGLQCSLDDSTWKTVPSSTVTGAGDTGSLPIATRFLRYRVLTAEGGVSTSEVRIQAK